MENLRYNQPTVRGRPESYNYDWAPSGKPKRTGPYNRERPYNPTAAQSAAEAALMKRWKEQDLAQFYQKKL